MFVCVKLGLSELMNWEGEGKKFGNLPCALLTKVGFLYDEGHDFKKRSNLEGV